MQVHPYANSIILKVEVNILQISKVATNELATLHKHYVLG